MKYQPIEQSGNCFEWPTRHSPSTLIQPHLLPTPSFLHCICPMQILIAVLQLSVLTWLLALFLQACWSQRWHLIYVWFPEHCWCSINICWVTGYRLSPHHLQGRECQAMAFIQPRMCSSFGIAKIRNEYFSLIQLLLFRDDM